MPPTVGGQALNHWGSHETCKFEKTPLTWEKAESLELTATKQVEPSGWEGDPAMGSSLTGS